MKQSHQLIYIESDEISMYLAESILSSFELGHAVKYFTELEEAMVHLKNLRPSPETRYTIFINASILIGEPELAREIKEMMHPHVARFCLLSSLPDSKKREKDLLNAIGISCYIEKPLTEERFLKALEMPFDGSV